MKWSGGDTQRWWGHFHAIFHSDVMGTQNVIDGLFEAIFMIGSAFGPQIVVVVVVLTYKCHSMNVVGW